MRAGFRFEDNRAEAQFGFLVGKGENPDSKRKGERFEGAPVYAVTTLQVPRISPCVFLAVLAISSLPPD